MFRAVDDKSDTGNSSIAYQACINVSLLLSLSTAKMYSDNALHMPPKSLCQMHLNLCQIVLKNTNQCGLP